MPFVPRLGDIVIIDLDVPKNREFAGRHHAVCLSHSSHTALFCPLTSDKGFVPDEYAVWLPKQYTGRDCWALVRQVKSLDWHSRGVKKAKITLEVVYVKMIQRSLQEWIGVN